jgi:hypothetical protein
VSGTATVWPIGCAKLRGVVSVMLDAPTDRMTRVSCFKVGLGHVAAVSLSMRTVWPGAKPVTFDTWMVLAPALEAAVRVAAAWTNLAQYSLSWGSHVLTISPTLLLLS